MVQLEADYTGTGYTLNAKSVNASPVDLTGIYVASALQSLTPRLAIGVECVVQHPQPGTVDAHAMLVAKYAVQGSSSGDYVWTVSASPMGTLATSYFQRISERIELGAELECAQRPDKPTVDAQCTLAGRMTFLKAQFRAQVDSNGRVAAVLEEKLHEGLTLVMSGDVDHGKGGAARFGLGLQVESDPSMQLY